MKDFLKETLLLAVLSFLTPIVLFLLGGSDVFFISYIGFLFLIIPYIIAHFVSSFLFWYKKKNDFFFKLFFLRSLYLFVAIIIALIIQLTLYKYIEISIGIIFSIIVFSFLTFNNFLFLLIRKITNVMFGNKYKKL